MFDTINGLPLHPLVVHAAVVLVPLSGVLGVLYAVQRTRTWARWALPVVSVLGLGSVFVATRSGEALQGALGFDGANSESEAAVLIERHSELGDQLLLIMVGYTVVALAAAVFAGRTSPSGGGTSAGSQPVAVGLSVLLVVGAVVVSTWTYRVGDLGSRAVWNPADSVDYSD